MRNDGVYPSTWNGLISMSIVSPQNERTIIKDVVL